MKKVIDLLADPDCEVIRPIIVDYNLIEVNDGYCWSISERRFLRNAIPADKVSLVTPRAFSQYDPLKVPQPKYFREVLENSFSEADIALFCEEFLRLLHFIKKKHKERVPCLVGEAASRKTSLFCPILGLKISRPWTEGCDSTILRAFQIPKRGRRGGCSSTQLNALPGQH